MKLPSNAGLVSPEVLQEILKRVNPEDIPTEVLEQITTDTLKNAQAHGVSKPQIEQSVATITESNHYNINDILNELITDPHTIRFRIKMKDALERVLGILIRYQHLMDIKRGISRGEICRNLSVKYRKNLDYILFELEKCRVISIINEHGRNYYKINKTSLDAANVLRESLRSNKEL